MLRKYQISDGRIVETEAQDAAVHMYISPDETEKAHLINTLQIDEHTYNSALDPDELSRLEFEAAHAAVIFKRPKRYTAQDNFLFKICSVGLFLFPEKLVIVMSDEAVLFDGRYFQKLRSVRDIFLKTIFRCTQHFEEHLNVIHKASSELEGEINKALNNKDLLFMFNLEKSLVYYQKAISSNSKVVDKIKLNAARLGFSQEEGEFLEDLTIETVQCQEEANTYLQLISNLMDAWVSMVSNNLNIRMKTLTIISICIMLPTLVVSVFSMNVALPVPQQGTIVPFIFIVALAVLSVVGIMVVYRLRKW